MSNRCLLSMLLLALALPCSAQNTRVLLDTDRGPLLVELDVARAPVTSNNFLNYVDAGRYNATLLQRVVPGFVIQGGGFRDTGAPVTRFAAIASERNNGLLNVPGSIAMALSGGNVNSATSDFFINTGNNTSLDGTFTAFGQVVFGLRTLAAIDATPVIPGSEQPLRMPWVRRAIRVEAGAFPILPLHTGAWFDPANDGKGFQTEVAQATGDEDSLLMVISWYDYFEGEQIWVSGVAPFALGDSSVTVPLQYTTGGEFGPAFDPQQVVYDNAWGSITLRFTACDIGEFTYTTRLGDGVVPVRSLTQPAGSVCVDN